MNMTAAQKREELLHLAKVRKHDNDLCPPHYHLACFHGGKYECDYVSPWSKLAHNLDAELMIIGQDWASSDVSNEEFDEDRMIRGQKYSSKTNTNLREFLKLMRLEFSDTYATNLFPFIKPGPKNATIPRDDLERCAWKYALPQIDIVSPRMALCLRKPTFDAVGRALGELPIEWIKGELIGPYTTSNGVEIYGMPHPGPLGIVNAGGKDVVRRIWRRATKRLQTLQARY
jgi:uracil-DNA glycosylase